MKKVEKLVAIAFLAIAVLSLVFSIVCFAMDTDHMNGDTVKKYSYGGDAYTGMQNASAQAASNVYYLGYNVSHFAHCVAVIAGFAFIITAFVFATLGVSKLMIAKHEQCVPAVTES